MLYVQITTEFVIHLICASSN